MTAAMMFLPLLLAAPAAAAAAAPPPLPAAAPPPVALAPSEIVAAAPAADWVTIDPADLLVMDLPPDAAGKARRVVIQLIPPPFAQGWVGNIRKLAAAHWWDGTSVNRVQDNYVVQWGDASEKKPLPEGLTTVPEADYSAPIQQKTHRMSEHATGVFMFPRFWPPRPADPYAKDHGFSSGWPVAAQLEVRSDLYVGRVWPVHCYGMVGVGRGLPPDTGTGAELYTVIGHAPRHLDRNIALVGRVIAGIEHLSSLPRGTGALGFYEKAEERVPIVSVRIGNEVSGLPRYQYLSTDSASFAAYADARANRRDAFFITPAGGADICNIPVPVRGVR